MPITTTRGGGDRRGVKSRFPLFRRRGLLRGWSAVRAGRLLASASSLALCLRSSALADPISTTAALAVHIDTFDVIQFAMFVGAMSAALASASWLIRERGKIAGENHALRDKVADLSTGLQRSEALLNLGDRRAVVWEHGKTRPEIIGSLPGDSGAPESRSGFLAFGRWLSAESAAALDRAVTLLRDKGRPFQLVVETAQGVPLDVSGRTAGGFAAVSFVSLGRLEAERAMLEAENRALGEALAMLRGLFDQLDIPVWMRGGDGRHTWVNAAYAANVEAADAATAASEERELLGTIARQRIERERGAGASFHDRLSTVVKGDRRVFDVTDFAGLAGAAGIALDVTEIEAVRAELKRTIDSHAETLDHLNTAVAIFDPHKIGRAHV